MICVLSFVLCRGMLSWPQHLTTIFHFQCCFLPGEMQQHYVHAVPPEKLSSEEKDNTKHRRMAIIFRHGRQKLESPEVDSGTKVEDLEGTKTLSAEARDPIGALPGLLKEGSVYGRTYLLENHAISNVQGGVSGTINRGCSAIIVSRQSKEKNESDDFGVLHYSSNGNQRGGSLFRSIGTKQPVRVFRSSDLQNPYRACRGTENLKKMYRYDGLYRVESCFFVDPKGVMPECRPVGEIEYTFKLVRLEKEKIDGNTFEEKQMMEEARNQGTMLAAGADWKEGPLTRSRAKNAKRKKTSSTTTKSVPVRRRKKSKKPSIVTPTKSAARKNPLTATKAKGMKTRAMNRSAPTSEPRPKRARVTP